jgi:hypothetical protein
VSSKRPEATPTNGNSIIPGLLGVLALLGLATGLAVEHQTRLELREERQALQQQVDRVTALLAEKEQQTSLPSAASPGRPMAGDSSAELLRLRAEVGALLQLTNEWARASNDNTEAHAALDRYILDASPKIATADFWPRDSWNFAGFASPDDALRSSLWASNNGNLQALLDSTTGQLLQKIQNEFEGKSADEAAIRAMDEVVNLKSVQVLNREYPSADTAVLTTAFADGTQTQTNRFLLKRIDNQWKLAGLNDN